MIAGSLFSVSAISIDHRLPNSMVDTSIARWIGSLDGRDAVLLAVWSLVDGRVKNYGEGTKKEE